jgi:telomere length regulation protein
LILKGPPGCGKTSILKAVETEFDLKVLKISLSTPRSGKAISRRFKNLTSTQTVHCTNDTHFSFGALLVVEDIDVILDADAGFMSQLNKYIPISKIPMIMTCREIPNDL